MTVRRHHALLRLGSIGLAVTLNLALPIASQAQRRDFTGTYQFSQVAQRAGDTSLTITLSLHNYSGAAIYNAAVVLYDSSDPIPNPSAPKEPVAGFDLIKELPNLREVTLRHRFTIPTHEYLRWEQGRQPRLMFLKPDSGGTQIVPIDLRRESSPAAGTQQNNAEVTR